MIVVKTKEYIAQRGSRCSIPGNIQSQIGQGSEQCHSVEGVPAFLQMRLD